MNQTIASAKCGKPPDLLVRQEELILDVTERLTQALENAGVTQAELAKRLGKSPGFVSQVFGGGRNLTLRSISDIATALSLRPTLQLSSEHESSLQVTTRWSHSVRPQGEISIPVSHRKSRVPPAASELLGELRVA